MTKKIFLIAGEPSGDALGAKLMKALKEQSPEPIEFMGVGGPRMQDQGLESLLPMDELCVMGIWEVISQLPRLIKLIKGMVTEIENRDPDALITIDLPDFNFEVASRIRKRGKTKAKLIHYVAPSVWAWRPKRAIWVSEFLDGLICLFPFEPRFFPKLRTEFVGHPLIEERQDGDGAAFRARNGIPPDAKTLGLFFGSRAGELKVHGPILKDVAALLLEQYPDLHLIIPTLSNLEFDVLKIIESLDCPKFVVTDLEAKWDAIAACDRAVAVSGTVGLELALAGVPHVVTYKAHPLTWLIVRRMAKVNYAHLANILLGAPVIPEYLQGKANAVEISKGILKLYKVETEAAKQTDRTADLRKLLGTSFEEAPSAKAASFVLSLIFGP
jgi:lipid-A-disaccharide synthase